MLPQLSVVVPTYRRPRSLQACLAALAASEYPRDCFEVIVVDDGSGDPPHRVLEGAPGLDAVLLTPDHGGPAAARNLGARRATGDFLAFTDDDCRPTPGWLPALARHLAAHPRDAVGGRVRNGLGENPFSTSSQLLLDFLYREWNERAGGPKLLTSNNFALPTGLFRELGGFDGTFPLPAAEDRELCDRLRARGLALRYLPDAVVDHFHALDARSFWHQHLRYGQGARHYHRVRRARGGAPLRPEPPSFYGRMLAFPFRRLPPGRALLVSSLVAVSQVANAVGYARGGGSAPAQPSS